MLCWEDFLRVTGPDADKFVKASYVVATVNNQLEVISNGELSNKKYSAYVNIMLMLKVASENSVKSVCLKLGQNVFVVNVKSNSDFFI
jgi:hypothetical protein